MMLDFYGLREQPFGVAPDPRFLYLSPTHREALASLAYGVESGRGFMALIAPPGMGKTTLLFHVLERVGASARTVFLFRNPADPREMLESLMADLEIETEGRSVAWMGERLNEILIEEAEKGRRFILIIDEAQNLSESVLETVRQWSNFETPTAKLMQIILAGQPALADRLMDPWLAQLRQRISILARLEPLSPREVEEYIEFRLRVAGCEGRPPLSRQALARITLESKGIPRNINNLCFHAFSLGYALQRKKVDEEIVAEAARDIDLLPLTSERHRAELDSVVFDKREGQSGYSSRLEASGSWRAPVESGDRSRSGYAISAAIASLLLASFWLGRHGLSRKPLESLLAWARPAASSARPSTGASLAPSVRNVGTAQHNDQARSQAATQANRDQSSAKGNAAPPDTALPNAPAADPGQGGTPQSNPQRSGGAAGIGADGGSADQGLAQVVRPEGSPDEGEETQSEGTPQRSRPVTKSLELAKKKRKGRSPTGAMIAARQSSFRPTPTAYHAPAGSYTGEISLATDPPGLVVLIDDQAAGRSPVQRLLSAGKHTYRVLPPAGGAPGDGTFEVKPAALVRISLTWPGPNAAAPPAGRAGSTESAAR